MAEIDGLQRIIEQMSTDKKTEAIMQKGKPPATTQSQGIGSVDRTVHEAALEMMRVIQREHIFTRKAFGRILECHFDGTYIR